jgi:prepilin peptidase dependent protein B
MHAGRHNAGVSGMLRRIPDKQRGFTIVELMITVALGLSVISSILVGYLATYRGSMTTLAQSKLGQEMISMMDLMGSELRRAGYSAETTLATSPATNSFNTLNSTTLAVYDNITSNTKQASTGSGSCIIYSYDMDSNGTVAAAELSGFRLNNGVVQMRIAGDTAAPDTCATASNTWSDLTDSRFMTVTALTFNLSGSTCLNTREPDLIDNDANGTVDNAAEANCYTSVPTVGSADITVETRVVAITITANLTNDSFVRQSITDTVRVRNDWIRVR